jgi:putative transposase
VKANPEYIVIEDLNVSGMMKNKHLARAIQEQKLYEFRRQLEYKCQWYGVRLIIADRFFPSSKTCSQCGQVKKDLKLSDRTYHCDCGLHIDRDLNAAINLREYGWLKLVS